MRGALIAATTVALLAGCSTYDSVTQRVAQSITPYRITVVQGNFVSSEMAAQMHVGMTRAQVRQVLGTPLLTDMFHADRWDYVFYFKRGSTAVVQQRDFVVNFSGDIVTSWQGGEDLPSNLELLAEIDGDKRGLKAASAAKAAAASAAVAASAPAAAPLPSATDTARTPSDEAAAAAAARSTDPNAQAAEAANRATEAVQTPSVAPSSARAIAPTANAGGIPPVGPNAAGQPQLQFHRPPPPAPTTQSNPVGPTGSQSGAATANPPQSPASSPSGD